MITMIKEIERKDHGAVAAIWCDVLGYLPVTEESVAKTYEKMKGDSRCRTFAADVNGEAAGFCHNS